jgi:transcriptional regulator with XRE-family HTH domain
MINAHTQVTAWRRERRIPQHQLAAQVGITEWQLSRIMRKRLIPSAPVCKMLAVVTGLDVSKREDWDDRA